MENAQLLNVGDEVSVFTLEGSGRPILEGHAVIIARSDQPHLYYVRFRDEKRSRLRFVNPDWQVQPERSFALLHAFWRSSRAADPQIDDFFPSDSPE